MTIIRILSAVCMLLASAMGSAAHAQTAPASFLKAFRYDAGGRLLGTISPPPVVGGTTNFLAVRNSYDSNGRLWRVETGVLSAWPGDAAPIDWSGFSIQKTLTYFFDANGRKIKETVTGWDGVVASVTQFSYDDFDRLICTAVRMNPLQWGGQTNACVPQTTGANGADRITKNEYDAFDQLVQVRRAVGTSLEEAYATYSYTPNGKQEYVVDAVGNRAKMEYDGFDRLKKWIFPSATKPTNYAPANQAQALAAGGNLNAGDFEEYGYDANGNRTSLRKRDGSTLVYGYDALNRMTSKLVPERAGLAATHTRDVYYGYDLRGLQTQARFDTIGGEGVSNIYDGFGRLTSTSLIMDGATRTLTFRYDAHGDRTRVTYPDGNYVTYGYDGLDRAKTIQRSGSATIASYGYNAAGQRDSFTAGTDTSYGYDGIGRLTSLVNNPAGSPAYNNSFGFSYNPASQITQLTRSNNAFVFTGTYNVTRTYTVNGLNQYGTAGAASFSYDGNGNLLGDGFSTFTYDVENRLVGASGKKTATLRYDPLGRLYEISGGPSGKVRFIHDGDALTLEYDGSGNLLRRYAHGADGKADDPIAWYEGAGFGSGNERLLRPDWQGSIVLATDSGSSTVLVTNRYDDYGIPQTSNSGRFQYTGQAWLPDLGMYYYKARIYSPTLGRFLQTDPIGYQDQINLYAYVANDPVNRSDPTGKDSISCNIVDGKATGCSFAADTKDTTTVTFNETRNWTGSDGKQYSDTKTTSQTYQGSISQESALSKAFVGVGDQILKSVGNSLSSMTGESLALSLKPASEVGNGNGFGPEALGSIGSGRQFNGRPGANTAQNRQVNDAARAEGLNSEQRRQLGRAVESESRQGGANLGYHDIREIARAIKSGTY